MTISLVGGGGSVNFETSPWAILEGQGLSAPSPRPDANTRTVQLRLLLTGGSANAIQTQVQAVERILAYADEQQRGRRGFPESFVGELNCYLDLAPSTLSAGGQMPVIGGVLALDDDWYSHTYWQQNYVKATLTLECRRDIYAAEVTGTKPATAFSSQPFSIAATDTGGNTGVSAAPIRLGIHASGSVYKNVYGAIYPNRGTLIAPILNSGSAPGATGGYNNDYNQGVVTSTSYVACGTVSMTTDGKPKRYLAIIKRRANGTAALNWKLQTAGGADISDVWPDGAPVANTWQGLVAGMLTYPNQGMTGTTGGASGTPDTFTVTTQIKAALQSGTGSITVDTDYMALIPMDSGAYFAIQDNGAVYGGATYTWLHVYNEDGILRAALADGPPGGTVTAIAPLGVTASGRPLPTLYPGDNKVVIVAMGAGSAISETFAPDLQWTIRPRNRSM